MTRIVLRAGVILAAVGMGWAVGKAQTAEQAFELVVDAPVAAMTITCVKGCALAWVERGVNPNSQPLPTFSYSAVDRTSNGARRAGSAGGLFREVDLLRHR
jgi:hypothetical protein